MRPRAPDRVGACAAFSATPAPDGPDHWFRGLGHRGCAGLCAAACTGCVNDVALALLLLWKRLEDRERRTGRIREDGEPPDAGDVRRLDAHGRAELAGPAGGRIGVVGKHVGQPAGRSTGGNVTEHAAALDASPGKDVV